MENSYSVYALLLPTNKIYVGMTGRKPSDRWCNGLGYKGQPVYNDIKKYGWDSVDAFVIYSGLSRSEASEKESEIIKALSSYDSLLGYNRQSGGLYGYSVSEETKEKLHNSCSGWHQSDDAKRKISESNTGKIKNVGHLHSEKTKRKISESNKGKKRSEEVLKKLSEQRKGRTHKGAVMTQEWRDKISKARKEYYKRIKESA